MREIFVGILLMFAFALPGFADTSVESPDWDVLTVGETESAAVTTLTPLPDRLPSPGAEDATLAIRPNNDGAIGAGSGDYIVTAGDGGSSNAPFEVGWRS
jgi:hypothetical protein